MGEGDGQAVPELERYEAGRRLGDELYFERCWHCLKLVEPVVAARAFRDRRRPCCDPCREWLFGTPAPGEAP